MNDRLRTALSALAMSVAVVSVGALAPQTATAATVKPAATAKPRVKAKPPAPAPQPASETVTRFADWVVVTQDNHRLPFAIVDKVGARVFVFDSRGRLKGATPALLGIATGDDSAPGVGDHKHLGAIDPTQRTTPAGRFFAFYGPAVHGERTLWVDYQAAISLHHVKGDIKEKRLQRLKTATPLDNRITYGCINVPTAFYEAKVRPTFATKKGGVVYVLPDTKTLAEVFPLYRERAEQTASLSTPVVESPPEPPARRRG